SSDGIAWTKYGDKALIAQKPGIPMFDTQNLAFWDPIRKHYWAYYRGYQGGSRDIFVAKSQDFITWTVKLSIYTEGFTYYSPGFARASERTLGYGRHLPFYTLKAFYKGQTNTLMKPF